MNQEQIPATEDAVEAEPTEEVSEEQMLSAIRSLKLVNAYRKGTMTYEQFQKLPDTGLKAHYIRTVGRPLSAEQASGRKRTVEKRKAAKKAALMSRRRNRR
jgi:hypothetical protein